MTDTLSTFAIDIPYDKIGDFCQHWQITEFALFGSVLRNDFRTDSDIDVLVTFSPDARWSLEIAVQMQEEIEGIFGRKVDLVKRSSVAASPNYIRRKAILNTAKVIYAA